MCIYIYDICHTHIRDTSASTRVVYHTRRIVFARFFPLSFPFLFSIDMTRGAYLKGTYPLPSAYNIIGIRYILDDAMI